MTASRSACTRLGGRCAPKHERSLGFPGWLTDLLLTSSSSVWHNSLRRPSPSAHEKRPEEERGAGVRPGWHGRPEGPPGQRPTTPGAARQRRQRGLHGVSRVLSFWGRSQELVAGAAGRRFVLPFAGESSGKRLTKRNEAQQQLPRMKLCPGGDFNRRGISDL